MKICTIGGIEIKINIFLIIFAVLWCASGYINTALIIFLAVTLHELAHAATAAALGIKVYDIVLYPFGGAARMDPAFEYSPIRECIIAAAGPLASVISAMACISLQKYFPDKLPDCKLFIDYSFLIAGFNLLPALPLDGGRIVRAIICTGKDRGNSSKIMATMGIILSICICSYGIYTFAIGSPNASFPILGAFLLISSITELKSTKFQLAKTMLYRSRSRENSQYMKVKTIAVKQDMPLDRLMGLMIGDNYYIIRVLGEHMNLVGTLDESTVENGIVKVGSKATIGSLLKLNTVIN